MTAPSSLYEVVGGDQFFVDLVDRFYVHVEQQPSLRAMYPDDLDGPRQRLTLFLIQYWGGPGTYSEQRGHPRLRMRHNPYQIDCSARDMWLGCMSAAVAESAPPVAIGEALLDYFVRSADFMRNVAEP